MDKFKEEIIKLLKKELKQEIDLEVPPDPEFGDYAFPCFSLAKVMKKSPNDIAYEISRKLPKAAMIDKIEAKGPYINFFLNKSDLAKDTLHEIHKKKERYGFSSKGKGKKVLMEHTSINPNASPHVGRARNALIGDSITRLLRLNSYNVETHYFVNDVGKQIAMLILGTGDKKVGFKDLLDVYIKVNQKLEKNKGMEKEVFGLLHKLEQGDKETKKKFKDIVDVCIKGQVEIFSDLNINYDKFDYESDYLWSKETSNVLKKLESTKKLFVDDEKRKVLDQKEFNLAMKSPVLVLTRADGTSLYPLRDIAYTIDKIKKGYDRNIIVLGEDQKLYFQQIKAALQLLGYKAPEVVHYSFVLLRTGKMSTRKGNLVLLEDFMEEAVKKAREEIKKRNKGLKHDELEKLAKMIGYGAIKYSILRVSPEKNVIFDWESALSFEGESAPYIQYAHARICSIFKKYGKKAAKDADKADLSCLVEPSELELIRQLAEFPAAVEKSAEHLQPHLIANYIYCLSRSFNEFYHSCQILKAEEYIKEARLFLISCVSQVLENGLSILGIDAPEHM